MAVRWPGHNDARDGRLRPGPRANGRMTRKPRRFSPWHSHGESAKSCLALGMGECKLAPRVPSAWRQAAEASPPAATSTGNRCGPRRNRCRTTPS
ncbi:hypothetical protein FRAHR75_40001 [Frankia sp. Hr75.2]|nr:hypothetical protein FRAHR75_40001 [Frankia sp. Hr75.2]SQD93640.1 hypothetical protein FMEAI12_1810002 [Parafrankia sp. Ea1.12]